MKPSRMYYTYKLTKTYTNGTTYTTRCHMDRVDEAKAKIDEEDSLAGLTGTWEEAVNYS